jgi:TP901 family phage tail tape measure protein
MASASGIRMGKVFVEIGADSSKALAAFANLNKHIGKIGRSLSSAGTKIAAVGAAATAPFAAAIRSGAVYESALLNIQASTGATAGELEKLKAASMQMSAALGKGPSEVAGGFLELLKAGMSVEQVLGGAGQAALEFASVGQMDVASAAVVMSDAMSVFAVDASTAANTISSAADASSTSIELMAQSMSQVSAVAAIANQSIDDTSAALAILANAGVKGSDAGTSLKTMLMRLMAPADDAIGALGQLGLSVASFRSADGQMKPLVDIIGTLNGALGGMDQVAKDDIFRRLFGSDAIRAAAILTSTGVEGFGAMRDAMGNAMPVGEKYKILMSGLAGAGSVVMAAMERLAVAVSEAVAPALQSVARSAAGVLGWMTDFAKNNKELVRNMGMASVAVLGLGGAVTILGGSIQMLSFGLGGVGKLAAVVFSPLGIAVAGLAAGFGLAYASGIKVSDVGDAIKQSFGGMSDSVGPFVDGAVNGFNKLASDAAVVFSDLYATASTTFTGISDALAAGDLSGAAEMLWLGLGAAFARGNQALMGYVDEFAMHFQNGWDGIGVAVFNSVDGLWTWLGQAFTNGFAVVQGIMDNVANGLMNTWDRVVGSIQKGWLYVQSFFDSGIDLDKEFAAIDSRNEARRIKREKERPGVQSRLQDAAERNREDGEALGARVAGRTGELGQRILDREQANRDRSAQRASNVASAEGRLTAKSAQLAAGKEATELLPEVAKAKTQDDLRAMYTQLEDLRSRGASENVLAAVEDAIDERALDLDKMRPEQDKLEQQKTQLGEIAGAATAGQSQAEVAGTFSSMALGGLGFGSSLAQQMVNEQRETNRILKDGLNGGPAVVD